MESRFVQILAAVLLAFGAVCVGCADRYDWRDLANVGNTIVGVGAGIITGQKLTHLSSGDNSSLTVAEGNEK